MCQVFASYLPARVSSAPLLSVPGRVQKDSPLCGTFITVAFVTPLPSGLSEAAVRSALIKIVIKLVTTCSHKQIMLQIRRAYFSIVEVQ